MKRRSNITIKSMRNKIMLSIIGSALFIGINVCTTANLVAYAEETDGIGVYEYSQKNKDDISSLLESKAGVIYVKDCNTALQDSVSLAAISDKMEETDVNTVNAVSFGEYYYRHYRR